ncbi:MAG: PQQ-binding-like beta-propeller repeat protein [Bdellovibrionota bacterium]
MNIKTLAFLGFSAFLGGVIAWAFKSSQEEIDRIIKSRPKIHSNVVWIKNIFLSGETPIGVGQFDSRETKDVIVAGGEVGVGRGPMIFALSGDGGHIIWSRRFAFPVKNEPIIIKINDDALDDVIVSGESNNVYALDGKNGSLLWSLAKANANIDFGDKYFSEISLIDDLDADGIKDLLLRQEVSNSEENNSAKVNDGGKIYKVSSKTGKILSSYDSFANISSSAAALYFKNGSESTLILPYGTASERGMLVALNYKTMEEKWRYPFDNEGKVFSLAATIPKKNWSDSVLFALNSSGSLVKLNTENGQVKWMRTYEGWEATTNPVLGHFNDDGVIDVAAVFSLGQWPDYKKAKIVWFDGKNGQVINESNFGLYAQASPLTADFNGDGYDELIVISNSSTERDETTPSLFAVFDGKTNGLISDISFSGYSASTPQLTDVDDNGMLDLLMNVHGQVFRVSLKHSRRAVKRWYKLNGPNGNGSFAP